MKRAAVIFIAMAVAVSVQAKDYWYGDSMDLGTYEVPADLTTINFVGAVTPYTITLSADKTIDGSMRIVKDNRTMKATFDFASGGNKHLTLKNFFTFPNQVNDYKTWLTVYGGIWTVYNEFYGVGMSGYGHGGATMVWDGVTLTNSQFWAGAYNANNSSLILTNGTTMVVEKFNGFFVPTPSKATAVSTNCIVRIVGGSKVIGTHETIPLSTDYPDGEGREEVFSDYHVEVSGEGSAVEAKAYPTALCVGYKIRGVDMRFSDSATGTFNNKIEIGKQAIARDNGLIIDSNASVKAYDEINIGCAVGADGNYLHVLDGAKLEIPSSSYVKVGASSSFNEFVLSNATFSGSCIRVGMGANASNNVARIIGPDVGLTFCSDYPVFFGAGHHNRFVVDGGASIGAANKDMYFHATEADPVCHDSFEILNGLTVTCDEFYIGHHKSHSAARDHDNRLIVAGCSALHMTDRILLRAPGDECIISNSFLTAYDIYAGYGAGASNTVFRFVGPETSFTCLHGDMSAMFGSGRYNLFEIDGATIGKDSSIVNFAETATSNNTLRIVNGGKLLSSGFRVGSIYNGGRCDVSNTVFVGANSVLSGAQIALTGLGNRLVVSNGTVVGTSQYPVSIGHVNETTTCPNSGNTIVLQGSTPLVTGSNPDRADLVAKNHSVIRFELSGDGFENVPFACSMSGDGTTEIEVSVDPKMMETLEKSRTYQLTAKSCPVPTGTTRDEYIAKINAGLPTGCRAYFDASNRLFVRVRALNGPGMTVIVR